MIKAHITFEEGNNAVYISLEREDPPSVRTIEVPNPMVFVDIDENNEVVGIEILGITNNFIPKSEIPIPEM